MKPYIWKGNILKDIIYFDLETQKLAREVGGWSNIHLMKLAVAVTYSRKEEEYCVYLEEDVGKLIEQLKTADLIVGFNIKRFDFAVIAPYTSMSLQELQKLPALDMLNDIYRKLGFRVSLDALASATLNETKSADGLQAVQWYKEGELDLVIEYCKRDVEVTKKLHEYGCKYGHVSFVNRRGAKQSVPVNWVIDWEVKSNE